MTASDDVRARFEAWVQRTRGWAACKARNKPMYLRQTSDGNYCDYRVNDRWMAYRAAHADLSGEVRELVEALDVARGKVNHVHLSLANNRVVGGSFSVDDETSCRWTGSLNIAGARLDDIRRALAKHTHQETK